jgi:hypothetical protein
MNADDMYDFSVSMATSLNSGVEDSTGRSDFTSFLRIRMELNQFLLNLNYCNVAEGTGQQIHFLFIALNHLENVDKEIRISGADQDIIRLEKIHEKIQSLKCQILNYIRTISAIN